MHVYIIVGSSTGRAELTGTGMDQGRAAVNSTCCTRPVGHPLLTTSLMNHNGERNGARSTLLPSRYTQLPIASRGELHHAEKLISVVDKIDSRVSRPRCEDGISSRTQRVDDVS
jgi:hypothetical protein